MLEGKAIQAAWNDVQDVSQGYTTKPYIQTTPHSGTDDQCCCMCNKPLRRSRQQRMVHLIDGGLSFLHPKDEALYTSDEGDMLWFFIGPDCAKKLGLEWTITLEP